MATKTAIWGHKQYAELNALRNRINPNILYVESLFAAANKAGYEGATVKEIKNSIKRVEKAAKITKAKEFGLSLKTYAELYERAWAILRDFTTGHSMGCIRKAIISRRGQEAKAIASYDTSAKYASRKWRAVHGYFEIVFTRDELKNIRNIEGIWTIVNADGTAKWLESSGKKNTYKVQFVNGFVFGRSHSKRSLRDAQVIEGRKLQAKIQAMQDDKRFVGVQDIRKTGACDAGIKAFCERHGLNPEFGYNLGFLKSFNDSVGRSYLQRVQK